MTDKATLETRLNEAEDALHALLTGKQAVSVSSDAGAVSYNRAGIAQLRGYIQTLKTELGIDSRPRAKRIYT